MSQIEEIKAFVQMVEAGSATAAAERMGVAVSAISRRLKDLEVRLGSTLITRTTRRMSLTENGERFYHRCKGILEDLQEAEQEVIDAHTELSGVLRVAAPLSFGIDHLSPAVAEFMHRHPELQVDLDLSDRRIDLISEGFDLAVRIGRLQDSSLIARKISVVSHFVCASPAFLSAHPGITRPEDLATLPGLCYSNTRPHGVWHYRSAAGEAGSVSITPRMLSSNGDVLREAAIAGLGVLCEPSFIVHGAIQRNLLKPILCDWSWHGLDVFAIYPKMTAMPKRSRLFVDFLAERFGSEPYWEKIT